MLPTIKRRFIIAMNSILFIAPLKHKTRNPNVHMNGKEGQKKAEYRNDNNFGIAILFLLLRQQLNAGWVECIKPNK